MTDRQGKGPGPRSGLLESGSPVEGSCFGPYIPVTEVGKDSPGKTQTRCTLLFTRTSSCHTGIFLGVPTRSRRGTDGDTGVVLLSRI